MSNATKLAGKGCCVLYVSTVGSDRWSGTLAEPSADGKDGPLATIVAARNAVRKLKKKGSKTPVKVVIRGGTYSLNETLTFGPEDSGTASAPVVYAAYPGEVPVFSGGRKISGWKTITHKGKTCWVADLPEVKAGKWTFTQLFVDGARRNRPRLPKTGFYRFTGFGKVPMKWETWYKGPVQMNYAPGEIKEWKNLDDVELIALQLWYDTHLKIKKVDTKDRVVHFRNPSIGSLKDEKNLFARYFVENVFEALDTPGEWYLDRPSGRLYYLPLPGEEPATTQVVAPVLNTLVLFKGGKKDKVRFVRLENLGFCHAEWPMPANYVGDAQASFSVPGAILFDRAEDCVLYGCEISHISQYAVETLQGCSGNKIVACSMHDMGAGGVKVGHEELLRKNETTGRMLRADKGAKAMRTTVSDCSIYDGGHIFPSAIGIWVGNSGRNRIRHNHIHHMRYTGISCGWTWGYGPTRTVDNRIEYNHIHHINHDGLISDNGGIYTLGIQPGTIIRGNVIHDIACYGYGGWGIYPDEGSSQEIIENNVVYRTQGSSYHTHYGRDNVARNNIFALSDDKHVIPGSRMEDHRTTIMERNIVYWKKGDLWFGNWQIDHSQFRDNLFWGCGRPVDFSMQPVEYWQKRGQLLNTVIADPLFVDPESGDFSLREDSPALKMGFKPIDVSKAGPRFRGKRPLSYEDVAGEKEEAREIVYAKFEIVEPVSFDAGGKPGKVRLTLTNVGEVPASGRVRFIVRPDGAGRLIGGNGFAYALKPGAAKSVEVKVTAAPGADKVIVETVPTGKGLVPSFVIAKCQRQMEWKVKPMNSLHTPDDVEKALASTELQPVEFMGKTIAEVALTVAGGNLAFFAKVHEADTRPVDPPWEGSSIELFGSMPKDAPQHVGQVFLQPATETQKVKASHRQDNMPVPAPTILLKSTRVEGGYILSALIPLKLLFVESGAKKFLFECKVNIRPDKRLGCICSTLFGTSMPSVTHKGFGTIILT